MVVSAAEGLAGLSRYLDLSPPSPKPIPPSSPSNNNPPFIRPKNVPTSLSSMSRQDLSTRMQWIRRDGYILIPHSPADRLTGLTLKSRGDPCLSPSAGLRTGSASWGAPPLPASARLNVVDLGEKGFGHFSRNKSGSAAGPRPGNTNSQLDIFNLLNQRDVFNKAEVVEEQDGFPIKNVGNDGEKKASETFIVSSS